MSWKKSAPAVVILISYILVTLILISGIGMITVLFLGKGETTSENLSDYFNYYALLMPFYRSPLSNPYSMVALCGVICWGAWLFTTRVRVTNESLGWRAACFLFAWGSFSVYFSAFAAGYLKPISYDQFLWIDSTVTTPEYREYLHTGSVRMLGAFIMMLPGIVVIQVWMRLFSEYRADPLIKEWFRTYQYQHRWLGRFGDEKANTTPDITLARDADKKTPVVLTGDSRQLGTGLLGPPGSGKTALKIIVGFRQDLGHLQKAINHFPKLVKKYGADTPAFKKAWAKFLIGGIIIEPAKDLCDKAYELSIEHGVPDELLVYLDPSNPDTPGFNAFVGPVEQVAEMIAMVLDGISESTDEFFRQSCRVVLKQYIYLLKFLRKNDCTILDLDAMYQDPRFVADLVEELEAKIPAAEVIASMPQDKRIYWNLVQRTIRWFWNDGIAPMRDKNTGAFMRFGEGPHKGKVQIMDKQFEFTRQTRNLLSDMIMNPYLARVLTKPNAVDLDRLMARGGILLCNTANGELGQMMSEALGKLVLISTQNAVFRRKGDEDTRPLVSLWVDEFYDYMNPPFLKLTSQARKYKLAPFVATQTLAQFDIKYGRGFTQGMLGTIRNWVVYGGVSSSDGELLEKEFGNQVIEELSVRESITPETMASPSTSYSETTMREEKPVAAADSIMFNEFKFSYIKMVVDKSTKRAFKAEGDFVDLGKASKWKKALNKAAVEKYMAYWHEHMKEKDQFDMDWIDGDDLATIAADRAHLEKMADEAGEQTVGEVSNPNMETSTSSVAASHKADPPIERKPVEYIGGGPTFQEVEKRTPERSRFSVLENKRSHTEENGNIYTETGPPNVSQTVPKEAGTDSESGSGNQGEAGETPLSQEMKPPIGQPRSASSILFGGETYKDAPETAPNSSIEEIATATATEKTEEAPLTEGNAHQTTPGEGEGPVLREAGPTEEEIAGNRLEEEETKKKQVSERRQTEKSKSRMEFLKPAQDIDENNPMFKSLFGKKKRF